jgi:tRNA pseudouridine55 synthase
VAQVDGFLNVCKPLGWTSHDVVGFVRRRIGQRRVGHAGTLDPAAAGVLPLCLGRATRLAERVAAGSKFYGADIVLGVTTDSGDADGRVLDERPTAACRLPAVVRALATQIGRIAQVPPAYSALKLQGVPAYARARRGEVVALAPREVTIHDMALVDWQPPRLSTIIHCSKGTYVRALARDLGDALDCGAHLDALVRLAVGSFRLETAITLDELEAAVANDFWRDLVLPPDTALAEQPALILDDTGHRHFLHGQGWSGLATCPEGRAYGVDGALLGLARAESEGHRWQPALSFVYDPAVATDA